MRTALPVELTTLDPAAVQDVASLEILDHVFEQLVRFNAKNEIEPALAEHWEVSKDGKRYTFHIRPGVKFHNGRVLTAADVKYSWERALDRETRSMVASNYMTGIVGLSDVVAGRSKSLVGVTALDATTLVVRLERPEAFFLGMISYPSNSVVCREAIERNGGKLDENAMVGTGPFAFESYRPGSRITFKANVDYWGGRPAIDRFEVPFLLSTETAYTNFETGAVDMWVTNVPPDRYTQDRDAGRLKSEYHLIPTAQMSYMRIDPTAQPAFAKVDVRLAIAMAIDRDSIARVAFKGVATRADGVIPPEIPNAGPSPAPIPYSPSEAKRLLARAGYPDGAGFPAITLSIMQSRPEHRAAAEIVRSNLHENLNVRVNIQERELGEFMSAGNKEQLEMAISEWIADYPDAQDFASTLFTSDATLNHTSYKNPAFDALCSQADAEPNAKTRAGLYAQANSLIMRDVGALPVVFPPRIALIQRNVTGWRANVCNFLPNTFTTKASNGTRP